MTVRAWLSAALGYLWLFPAAASCYLPLRNQLRCRPGRIAASAAALLLLFAALGAWAQLRWGLLANQLMLPAAAVFFCLFRRSVRADLPRTAAVFAGVCAVETFPGQLANIFDAAFHPALWYEPLSPAAAALQLGLALLLLGCAYLLRRPITAVVDSLDAPRIWYSTAALSAVFLVLNVAAVPNIPDLYAAGRSCHLLLLLQLCAMALLVCIYVLFYHGAMRLCLRTQLALREQLYEMQSHQYLALQAHMRETARLRHDFRHSVRLLSALAAQGKLAEIQAHLAAYEQRLAGRAPVVYCENAALNALFGYYREQADAAGIDADWRLELPEPLTVPELDLVSLFGNLLENGIRGCQTAPPARRYFSLTAALRPGGSLYIVSTNSFDGRVCKGPGGYRSTRHAGRGFGIPSIIAVAEKLRGSASFSHSDREFYADVVIQV